MARDFFEGRIQQLHDTEEHWQLVADTFIPLPGEACITLDDDNKGRVKYGDGLHTWGELPYSNDGQYDNKSVMSNNHVIQLVGYEDAEVGQIPVKTDEGLDWLTPVNTVYIGSEDNPVQPTDGKVLVPIAGEDLGVVKESSEVGMTEEGSVVIKKVDADKIKYNEDETIKQILDKRTLWEPFQK